MKFPNPGPMVMLKQPSSGVLLSENGRRAVRREPVVKLNIEGWGSGSGCSWLWL